jgi:hypothetical protein
LAMIADFWAKELEFKVLGLAALSNAAALVV